MKNDRLIKLRHRESVRLFDSKEKLFHHIQINPGTNFICWQRWVSKDKQNWIKWNDCLTLKEALSITFNNN